MAITIIHMEEVMVRVSMQRLSKVIRRKTLTIISIITITAMEDRNSKIINGDIITTRTATSRIHRMSINRHTSQITLSSLLLMACLRGFILRILSSTDQT